SWIWTKLTLPCPRLSITRPATLTRRLAASIAAASAFSNSFCRSPANASGAKSFGNAMPFSRNARSFSRRSAINRFSSGGCEFESVAAVMRGFERVVGLQRRESRKISVSCPKLVYSMRETNSCYTGIVDGGAVDASLRHQLRQYIQMFHTFADQLDTR